MLGGCSVAGASTGLMKQKAEAYPQVIQESHGSAVEKRGYLL